MWGSYRFILLIGLTMEWIQGRAVAFSSSSGKQLFKGKLTGGDEFLNEPGIEEQSGGALHRHGINIWTGKNFQIEHTASSGILSCTEEIILKWDGEKEGRKFQAKCPGKTHIRNVYHIDSVMLIGNADDNFCLFTSKNDEYYFKQKGKWTKVEFKQAGLKEEEIETPAEITRLTDRIKKWDKVIQEYVNALVELQKKKTEGFTKSREAFYRLYIKKGEEYSIFSQKLAQIAIKRNTDNQKEAELRKKYNTIFTVKGGCQELWDTEKELNQVTAEKQAELTKEEEELKKNFQQSEEELVKQMDAENKKNDEEKNKYDENLKAEQKKFEDKIKELLGQGN